MKFKIPKDHHRVHRSPHICGTPAYKCSCCKNLSAKWPCNPTVGVTYTSGSARNNTQPQHVDETNNICPAEPPDPTQYHLSGNATPGGDTRILPSEVVATPGENALESIKGVMKLKGSNKR